MTCSEEKYDRHRGWSAFDAGCCWSCWCVSRSRSSAVVPPIECIAVPFLPQCFEDDDDKEKTDDTATQTRVRVNARADDIDTTMVALRHTLAGTDVTTQRRWCTNHLDEISLSLDVLRDEVVHRDDGFHLRVDGLNRAIRSSVEAIRAVG